MLRRQLFPLHDRQSLSRRHNVPNLSPVDRRSFAESPELAIHLMNILNIGRPDLVQEVSENLEFLLLFEISVLDREVNARLNGCVQRGDAVCRENDDTFIIFEGAEKH